ncbi:MAG TPA: PQQ-binding-like beta-propeller repeat protein [Pirellulaceae bacterium]
MTIRFRLSFTALSSACLAVLFIAFVSLSASAQQSAEPSQQAAEILDATKTQGGIIVHLGVGDGRLTAALRNSDGIQVQGLDRDPAAVEKARDYVKSRDIYGDVSIDQLRDNKLPYVDNFVNLVVADDLDGVDLEEVMRVLVPNGVAYFRAGDTWKKVVKPRPKNIDEWTHYLHDSGGNAVAHDDVVGPPKHLQWLGSPRWSRHHDRMASMSALVSANGRVIYIMDEGSRISIQTPPKWTLIARDAFNGTVLWQQRIDTWQNHLWPLKSGPTQLARRLVAIGDRVYVTLGIDAPVSAVDAATGAVLHSFEDSDGAEEFVAQGGVLVAVVNKGQLDFTDYAPKFGTVGDQARIAKDYAWNEDPRQLMGFDIETGKRLWKLDTKVSPLSLAADNDSVVFHDSEQVVCLDQKTGTVRWKSSKAERRSRFTINFGTRLLLHGDVVLFAGGDRMMRAYSKKDGKELWNAPHAQSGYQSPEDLLVAGGLVWNAPTTRTQDTGAFTGRDPKTGETKIEFPPDVNTYWFHHRCYIAKATDNFIIPSRTGIEFVDIKQQEWNINHWVRGGCLYGVMPCNGLTYAPPHDCACYPEAKLYGMNALAPTAPTRQIPSDVVATGRLSRGPAFGKIEAPAGAASNDDWPTYRHDSGRSGSTTNSVSANLQPSWQTKLGGKLSSVVVADGRLYVAQVNQHTLHALNSADGQRLWSFTAGARVDSPPTVDKGRVFFGSTDGCVYCLRATDGALAWRFRAAPADLRLTAFEQIESVWPVHGSVLLREGEVYFVAGRSNFLDGGLRFIRLKADTGEMISETIIDEKDPDTGGNIQDRLQVLQMPVGLPDVLSFDGKSVYMRSQQFDLAGKRLGLGPNSGQAPVHAAVQKGETAHLFAPMGFLDDTWFHRTYWVYGRSFAGGHNGYYQAGKYTPAGRIIVADDSNVYGFARKPQYLKWTTTMEYELFSANKKAADQALAEGEANVQRAARRGETVVTNLIRFEKKLSLNPMNTGITMMAWVNAEQPSGVIAAHGGPKAGYALALSQGRPKWFVRTAADKVVSVTAPASVVGGWVHVAGVLTKDKQLELYVNGRPVASDAVTQLITSDPAQSLEIGGDDGGAVGDYTSPSSFLGTVDEFRLYHGDLSAEEIASLASPEPFSRNVKPRAAKLKVYCSFDDGTATDQSGNNNNGKLDGNRPAEGRIGGAMRFQGGGTSGSADTFVKYHWNKDLPLMVNAMVKAGDVLFVAGPPDLIDEEETFQKLAARDPYVNVQLKQQDDAYQGKLGARLQAVSATDGKTLFQYQVDSLPVWDGMAAANGKLYFSTSTGDVHCFAGR